MSFVKLQQRIQSGPPVADAAIAFRMRAKRRTGNERPTCWISLRHSVLEAAGIADEAPRFDIAIGQGEHDGSLRLTPRPEGVFASRGLKLWIVIDCGYIPQFGAGARDRQPVEVSFADGAFTLVLPRWEAAGDARPKAADLIESLVAEEAPVEQETPSRAVTPPPKRIAIGAARSVSYHGIIINLTEGAEAVTVRGRTVEVSPRGARLVECLARVTPSCVADAFLIEKLWEKRPVGAETHLEMLCRDLGSLKKLGLELRNQRGIGRQIVMTEAKK
jgi:hypothetical protein